MTFFEAIVLGVVQGITEFLPISSSGHLVLARSLFGLNNAQGLAVDAVLQLATIAAVVVYFFPDIYQLCQTLLRKLGRLPVNPKDEKLLYALLLGTIPAVVFGLMLESLMESAFRHPLLVAGVLVAGSIFFMYAEYVYQKKARDNEMTARKGLGIGFFQTLALIPGMSRSGATIAGGMLLGLSRTDAARFAFLLAVPVIAGAGAKKLLELMASDGVIAWGPIAVGSVVAFVTGLLAIHFLLSFVRRHTLWPFIWYRLVLAAFVIFVSLLA